MLWLLLVNVAAAGDGAWSLAPFGAGAYIHDRPVRGAVYTGTQAGALGTLVWSSIQLDRAEDAEDASRTSGMRALSGGMAAALGVCWVVSVVDSSRLHELEAIEVGARAIGWDAARRDARLSENGDDRGTTK